ncbi:hypothetical protein [Tsukamurella ocularis]|uniref:hypothetical protein n=1 Tax=Tsukamurella ocularis TaxID=1970234 RepID=UPI0021678852|nr:hypothetical protein [Tsukamurella ocularis]MCS3782395.1 hypothetical protein [Tsukamurella ocularis]MCS3789800.1 hypothetical protein [Tsukamurella ocularis]MCS3853185.1 hypothetical protein [Tsukamurella ocularis]
MDYLDVIAKWIREFNDETVANPAELTGTEPIPAWWAEVTGPNGGTLLANKWDELAPTEIFPQTKALLRSEHTLGVAILRSYPGGPEHPARWNLVVALDHYPDDDTQEGPVIIRLAVPLDAQATPPWWSFFPPSLRSFFLQAHRDIGEGVLTDPSAGVILASHRFDLDNPEDLCAFQPMPDPRELVLVAAPGEDQLYLDIGQQTYQGWEVPGIHDLVGGPRPVDLLETIDAYIVNDYSSQEGLPETDASQAIYPPPLRPRNPAVDWPNDPFWQDRYRR